MTKYIVNEILQEDKSYCYKLINKRHKEEAKSLCAKIPHLFILNDEIVFLEYLIIKYIFINLKSLLISFFLIEIIIIIFLHQNDMVKELTFYFDSSIYLILTLAVFAAFIYHYVSIKTSNNFHNSSLEIKGTIRQKAVEGFGDVKTSKIIVTYIIDKVVYNNEAILNGFDTYQENDSVKLKVHNVFRDYVEIEPSFLSKYNLPESIIGVILLVLRLNYLPNWLSL